MARGSCVEGGLQSGSAAVVEVGSHCFGEGYRLAPFEVVHGVPDLVFAVAAGFAGEDFSGEVGDDAGGGDEVGMVQGLMVDLRYFGVDR